MNYKIDWTFSALNSYEEEIDFIYLKWNLKEVLKFEKLVILELERLSKNPTLGILKSENMCLASNDILSLISIISTVV